MFKRLKPTNENPVEFDFEGRTLTAQAGDTVAAALLGADVTAFRSTPVNDRPRGPFCMMGVCFDCLMVIDGMPNTQACQVTVTPGMKVARQKGAAVIGPDNSPDNNPGDGAAS
jgi:D-hydroxyproline dehydrogenase subunit gamma